MELKYNIATQEYSAERINIFSIYSIKFQQEPENLPSTSKQSGYVSIHHTFMVNTALCIYLSGQ